MNYNEARTYFYHRNTIRKRVVEFKRYLETLNYKIRGNATKTYTFYHKDYLIKLCAAGMRYYPVIRILAETPNERFKKLYNIESTPELVFNDLFKELED